jgi:hypothetical protein
VVNWEAWSAIGTVLAVFVAIFAPWIQRYFFLRSKANAVFSVAYWADIVTARIAVERVLTEFPLAETPTKGAVVEASLKSDGDQRLRFRTLTRRLESLASRELDGSKWPAVDLSIVLAVAQAIHAAHDVVQVGEVMVEGNSSSRDWRFILGAFRGNIDDSLDAIYSAEKKLRKVRPFPHGKVGE